MKAKKSALSLAVGSAFAAGMIAMPAAHAENNPFAMQQLQNGYMVADNHAKPADAKAAEGKCGGKKDAKAAEGKCGGKKDAKAAEGKCGGKKEADMKAKEGKCGNAAKMKDGKCGEGKCGGKKADPKAAPAAPADKK